MQLIQTEKYATEDRDFEIYTYRDNNSDQLIIESHEIAKGMRVDPAISSIKVPMNGDWNLKPHEYPDYSTALASAKQSIIFYTAIP